MAQPRLSCISEGVGVWEMTGVFSGLMVVLDYLNGEMRGISAGTQSRP